MTTIQLAADDRGFGLSLPPADAISQEEIAAAVSAFRQARDAEQQAQRDATEAEQQLRHEAMQADATLLADALEFDGDDPGTPNVEEADRRIAAAQRKAQASRIVTQRRVEELQAALENYGSQWVADLESEHSKACAEWQRALDSLLELQKRIADIRAIQRFTTHGRYSGPAHMTPFIGRPVPIRPPTRPPRIAGDAPAGDPP